MQPSPEVRADQPVYPPQREMAHPFDPPRELLEWSRSEPVKQVRLWDGSTAWLVTRFTDIQRVLTDNDSFSADPRKPGFTEKSASYSAVMGTDRNLRTMDNPEHGVQKRMLAKDFTVKRIGEMEPTIRSMIEGQIDAMLAKGPPADIFADLAFLVPTWVICELLGVPFADRDYFAERSATCISQIVTFEEAAKAGKELADYLDALIEVKQKDPKDDLMSRLVHEQLNHGLISRVDLIGLARFLLIAGHETTANTMALSTLALLNNPDQLADLKANADDQAFMSNAIDELLRYLSVAHTGRRRVTIRDVEVGGVMIPAEQPVVLANNVGDRDEAIFENPDKLDLRRANAKRTMVFGYGIHQCLGQLLTRRELVLFHRILWKRMPNLQLAIPFSEVKFNETGPVFGVESVPVKW